MTGALARLARLPVRGLALIAHRRGSLTLPVVP